MKTIIFNLCKMTYSYFLIRFGKNTIRLSINRNFTIDNDKYEIYANKVKDFLYNNENSIFLKLKTNMYNITLNIHRINDKFYLHYDKLNYSSKYGIWEFEFSYNENKEEINEYLLYLFPEYG